MNNKLDLNIDQKTLEACLKEINNIGGTIYRNVCTGQDVYVPWGSSDWFVTIILVGTLLGIGLLFYYEIRRMDHL